MTIVLQAAALNLCVAMVCGAVIGSERQVRQRMAGLRTNALVAIGAAAFVVFSQLVPNEVSPTRVAAQVVSGIGFLGAGIIFRDGFSIHGLNTAATLWCSAAVGLVAGIGAWDFALILTAMVVFVNLGLRPLVKFLKQHTKTGVPLSRSYRVILTVTEEGEAAARGLMLRTLSSNGLRPTEIAARPAEEGKGIDLTALVSNEGLADTVVEQTFQRMAAEPGLIRLRWQPLDEN
jgi:putative Mg2+ transporter-C (MgtC) family protein